MSETFWKATRPDGTDFYTGTIDYAAALASGQPVTLPEVDNPICCTGTVLHASTVPAGTLIGGAWPCRLFEVTGTPVAEEGSKRGFFSLTVIREVDVHLALGPQGEHVAALIDRARRLGHQEPESLRAARDAARDAAQAAAGGAAEDAAWAAIRGTSRVAAWGAAVNAAWGAAWEAVRDAAWALVVRDLIGQHNFKQEHYDLLTRPWRTVIGPIHPDDDHLKGQDDE